VRVENAVSFDLDALLEKTGNRPVGALALAYDYLCVTHNLPLRDLHRDDFSQTLTQLCELAVECLSLRRRPDLSKMTHVVD
jgi:hypothetical protein